MTTFQPRAWMRALSIACVPLALAVPLGAQEDTTAATAAVDTSRVYELTEVDQAPRPENVSELRAMLERGYPPTRLAEGTNGRVIVEMVVGSDGSSRELRVATSTDSAFDAPSLAATARPANAPSPRGCRFPSSGRRPRRETRPRKVSSRRRPAWRAASGSTR